MNRKLKRQLKKVFLTIHKIGLRIGVVILPRHYYVAVPDLNKLRRTRHLWAHRSELPGVATDLDRQVQCLQEICVPFESEYRGNTPFKEATASHFGLGFGYIEAQALYGVIRHFKPKAIVEVGSGVSTYCSLAAIARNEADTDESCEITCVEPHPSAWLKQQKVNLIPTEVQEVPLQIFEQLSGRDLLFIDSSHTVKTGSDVNFLILEVLPRLKAGVLVHFHDIYLPYDYPRNAMDTIFQWSETSLLHAFLIGNSGVEILFCLSQLHYDRKDALAKIFPEYAPQRDQDGLIGAGNGFIEETAEHFPASIFLRVVHEHQEVAP